MPSEEPKTDLTPPKPVVPVEPFNAAITRADLAGLTEEERAALVGDGDPPPAKDDSPPAGDDKDPPPAEAKDDSPPAGDDKGPEVEKDDPPADGKAKEKDGDPPPAGDDKDPPPAEAKDDPPPTPPGRRPVVYPLDPEKERQARGFLDGMPEAMKSLQAKAEAGDITDEELKQQQDELAGKAFEASQAVKEQEQLRAMNEAQRQTVFAEAQDAFMARPENKVFVVSDIMRHALQGALNDVAKEKDWKDRTFAEMLAEAGRRTKEATGHPAKPATSPDEAARKKDEAAKGRETAAKTLQDAPEAGKADGGGGAFTQLDQAVFEGNKDGGMSAERQISNMSEEELDKWLRED